MDHYTQEEVSERMLLWTVRVAFIVSEVRGGREK
jgi:hypothetical protein